MNAPKKNKKAPPPKKEPHYLQFILVDESFQPLKEARAYSMAWSEGGQNVEKNGQTTNGMTEKVVTQESVSVTLAIAPEGSSECKHVGSTRTRPGGQRAEARVQLKCATQSMTAPAACDKCEVVEVPSTERTIQFVIDNVPYFESYKSYLIGLPYLIVDVATKSVLFNDGTDKPKRLQGSRTQVRTEVVNVSGVAEVGLVLGNATDEPEYWKNKDVILYKTKPREKGATIVTITEKDRRHSVDDGTVDGFKADLNGAIWDNSVCRTFTSADARRYLPAPLTITSLMPNDMQLNYAIRHQGLNPNEAEMYRMQRSACTAAAKGTGCLPQKPLLPPLVLLCSWEELLGYIYEAKFEGEPPNPIVRKKDKDGKPIPVEGSGKPLMDKNGNPVIDEKTKQPKIDPKTIEYETTTKYSAHNPDRQKNVNNPDYPTLCARGSGLFAIPPLGLLVELNGSLSGTGEDFCRNANIVCDIDKKQVLRKTHPYVYAAILETAMRENITYIRFSGGWRPMLGSIFHKLADGLDIVEVDSDSDALRTFIFKSTQVNDLAERFLTGIKEHPYTYQDGAGTPAVYYNFSGSASLKHMDGHNDHVHYTGNRLWQQQQLAAAEKAAKSKDAAAPISPTTTPASQ